MRSPVLIAAALVLAAALAGPAAAAEGPAAPDQSVTLATVAVPLVFDGQIVNYVFVSTKLLLTPRADATALRDKEPFFRDALVRAAHRAPYFVRAGDYNHVDDNRLKTTLYREASAIAGPGIVQGVQILSETPEHRPAPPRAPAGRPSSPEFCDDFGRWPTGGCVAGPVLALSAGFLRGRSLVPVGETRGAAVRPKRVKHPRRQCARRRRGASNMSLYLGLVIAAGVFAVVYGAVSDRRFLLANRRATPRCRRSPRQSRKARRPICAANTPPSPSWAR